MSVNHLDVVAQAKADLLAAGTDLSGACGAFAICQLVAWRLRPQYGLLRKAGGTRAIPRPDGSCVSDAESTDPGFATDYLIALDTFFGYDILGDGGGRNDPQWPETPETAPNMVARNRANWEAPFDPGGIVTPPPPGPTPIPVPVPVPVPTPIDLAAVLAQLTALTEQVNRLETTGRLQYLDLGLNAKLYQDELKRVIASFPIQLDGTLKVFDTHAPLTLTRTLKPVPA